ncbi:MAG: calcineurin-like phosphoesterase C-terminal domain-containing protein [Alistipes sp.]|nr:calcineurin-like phosphoesterase C-terminal domain-containing protein [Alistipes sp.]
MKRTLSILVFALLAAVSCVNTEEGLDVITSGRKIDSFTANIVGDDSRTISILGADGSLDIYWHSSDCLAVTDGDNIAKYTLDSGECSDVGTFVVAEESKDVSFSQTKPLYGVYPDTATTFSSTPVEGVLPSLGVEDTEWDDTTRAAQTAADNAFNGLLCINIPTVQNYSGVVGRSDRDRNIMVGTTADNGRTFDFKMVASVAQFNIKVAEGEKILSLTMSAEGANLSGRASVDVASLTIEKATEKSVTLNYENPVAGSSAEGWALIAPVAWTQTEGKVFYTITTDGGVYTFCKKPTKDFAAGYLYKFNLDISKFTAVTTADQLEDGCYLYESHMVAKFIRATDSTAVIGWTVTPSNVPYIDQLHPNMAANYAEDLLKTYKVALYRDAACTDLVVSVSNVKDNLVNNTPLFTTPLTPPRFVFSGLQPSTTYYAKVWNTTDSVESNVVEVKTAAPIVNPQSVVSSNAKAGDLILFENFAALIYGGDMSTRAAGVSRTDRNKITDLIPLTGEITSSSSGFYAVGADTEIGLFNTMKSLIDDYGYEKWGWICGKSSVAGGSVCARPGFLKIGTTDNCAHVCTPALNAIPTDKVASVRVVFKAIPYGSLKLDTIYEAESSMSVRALSKPTFGSDYGVSYQGIVSEQKVQLTSTQLWDWREYTVTLTNVPSGASISLGGGAEPTTTSRLLLDDVRIYVDELYDAPPAGLATGYIKYSDGSPAVGIAVTDGFTVTQTDATGKYELTVCQDTWYIYYTIPADCQVPINSYGQPVFFEKYVDGKSGYSFTLNKLPNGKETKFSLFCLADPQCKDSSHRNRFNNESVPDIKSHISTKGVPCYGVTLGDVVYSEGSRNCDAQMPYMRDHMAKSNIGMPIFQTMGNHDYSFFSSSKPISADATSSTYNMKAQRVFENVFGPIDYSWDRGDAHIVCMRNMQWNSNTSASDYSLGFTDAQYNWLKQDLALVPKDKLVIFCVHVPLTNSTKKNVQNVINLLKQFDEAHIMSGHTHYHRNEPTLSGGVFEHIHAAVCGQWWYSNMNGDGCPNGYGVYDINGSTIENWYYKGVNPGMNDRGYQMRLYRGNLKCGGTHEDIQLQHGDGVLLANIFNADKDWTIKVYEDGVYSGNMTMIPNKKVTPAAGSPTKPSTDSSQDWWAIGYHIGVVGRGHVGGTRVNYLTNGFHLYKYTLKNKSAKIRVEATDRFGTVYSCSDITGDYDYTLMER